MLYIFTTKTTHLVLTRPKAATRPTEDEVRPHEGRPWTPPLASPFRKESLVKQILV